MGRKLKLSNLIEQKRQAPKARKTHMDITWSSPVCVKVGQQQGKHLKQPGPCQGTMGKSEATAKRQEKARDKGDRAKPYCPSTQQIVEKLSRHPAA